MTSANKMTATVPNYQDFIEATFLALKQLGDSGKNDEINKKSALILDLTEEILEIPHKNSNMTEVNYRLAWARTLLKRYGAIVNSARGVWIIKPEFSKIETVDSLKVYKCRINSQMTPVENIDEAHSQEKTNMPDESELPEEIRSWRNKLSEILSNINPYAFERLSQRILRECGFSQVEVTKKSGDGGIDGRGKLKINGVFTFNVAFQCKRYQGSVGAPAIRDFRGSLTTDIEKAVFITTGRFSKLAIEEASTPGKQQIDLMNGEELISKLAEFSIGVKEVTDFEIDEDFFATI